MKGYRAVIGAALCLLLGACASITTGTTQTIQVSSTPRTGAACNLQNEKGTWYLPATPGNITVNKAYGPLSASCTTDDGWSGAASVDSTTAGAAFGNILAGGIIGAAVDMSSGAAYIYPATMSVALSPPADGTSPAAEPAPLPGEPGVPVASARTTPIVRCRVAGKVETMTMTACLDARGSAVELLPADTPVPSPAAAPGAEVTLSTPRPTDNPASAFVTCRIGANQWTMRQERCTALQGEAIASL